MTTNARHGNRPFMLMTTIDDYDPAKACLQYLDLDPACQEWETLMDRHQQRLPNVPAESLASRTILSDP